MKFPGYKIFITVIMLTFCIPAALHALDEPCGDINASGSIDISDIFYMVDYLFNDGPSMPYYLTADLNNDYYVDIADIVALVDYLLNDMPMEGCSFVQNSSSGCLNASGKEDFPKFSQSSCLESVVDSTEMITLEWIGDKIKVNHLNAHEQCCLEYKIDYDITYDYDLHRIDIQGTESDIGEECDCMCYFNLESYTPFLGFGEEMLCYVTIYKIDGTPLPTDTITVGHKGSLICEPMGSDLVVTYKNAYYNCCPHFMTIIDISSRTITISWQDTLGICLCLCYYDLQTTLNDLEKGLYTVVLLGGDFGQDTIGVKNVLIQGNGPDIVSSEVSECKEEITEPLLTDENLNYTYDNGKLYFQHIDAEFNCSILPEIRAVQFGDTLRIYELNQTSEHLRCLCLYDINTVFSGIFPGTYTVEVYQSDWFWQPYVLADRRIVTF